MQSFNLISVDIETAYLRAGLVGDLVEEVLDELVERLPVGMLAVLDAVVALDGEATRLGIRRLFFIVSVIAVVTIVTVVSLISALLLANLNLT